MYKRNRTELQPTELYLGGGTGAWSSDNTAVATVDANGIVTAVSAGTANITYTISDGCNGTPSATSDKLPSIQMQQSHR